MKGLIVRVSKAEVLINSKVISSIGRGLALFVGIEKNDAPTELVSVAEKVANLRIFEDENGKMQYSVTDKNYPILCISNFTLCANTKKGRRPSFEESMSPENANKLFNDLVLLLKSKNLDVKTGSFGQHMDIRLELDGPVNITIDSNK